MAPILRHLRLLLILPAALGLFGCLGSGDGGTEPQIRLLNVSRGYDALELYTTNDDSDADVKQISSVAAGTVSSYVSLKADTYTIKIRKTGASGSLLSTGTTLAEETNATYVAFGPSGSFGAVVIDEDVAEPDSGSSKVKVVNTTGSGGLDVYLTSATDELQDVTATFSGVGSGAQTDPVTIASGSYRLRVTGSGDTSDIRMDVSGIELGSKQVLSVILTDTNGGVLLNATLLPQQGDPSSRPNPNVRIRGAAGVSGAAVTANVAGTNILTRAAAGVINNSYTVMTAGSAAVNVYLDGTLSTSSSQSLVAGGDYTLLVWNDPSGTHTTLLTDDNHLATSGKAKLRLLNGMSSLGEPITLSIDYSPIAEFIPVGTIAPVAEVSGGSEYQFDVTNANTTALLLSRTSVSLSGAAIYTYFVSGGGTAPVVATLRKDR
jgi:hypothetical protein